MMPTVKWLLWMMMTMWWLIGVLCPRPRPISGQSISQCNQQTAVSGNRPDSKKIISTHLTLIIRPCCLPGQIV